MVTMNSDKAAIKRKPDPSTSSCSIQSANEEIAPLQQSYITDESPNLLLYKRVNYFIIRDELTLCSVHGLVDGENHRKNAG